MSDLPISEHCERSGHAAFAADRPPEPETLVDCSPASLPLPERLIAREDPASVPPSLTSCPKCHRPSALGAKRCVSCGKRLTLVLTQQEVLVSASESPRIPCPRCGTQQSPERETCAICELPLSSSGTEKQAEAKPVDYAKLPVSQRPSWYLHPDSDVRKIAVQAVLMRQSGMTTAEVAKHLKLSEGTVYQYIYKAGRNGFLDFDNPKDRLDYQIMHKVVRNIDQFLDDDDKRLKFQATMETFKGTLSKQYDQPSMVDHHSNVLAIKIETSGPVTIETVEGIGGNPAYVEGEVLNKE